MKRHIHLGILIVLIAATSAPPLQAALSVYVTPEQLAERAPLIVDAVVIDVRSGFDPDRSRLATYVTLDVEYVHRGPRKIDRVVVREPGGTYGRLVHHVDAVPRYRAGERVLAFLEPGSDGALRTAGMFFGKFSLPPALTRHPMATRELGGQGWIRTRPGTDATESIPYRDLAALAASARHERRVRRPHASLPGRSSGPAPRPSATWLREPPELTRLRFDDRGERDGEAELESVYQRFTALSANPARWNLIDSGAALVVNVDPGGNPLGNDAAAVFEMERAMAAWTDVPESRLALAPGDTAYDYPANFSQSPAASYSGVHVILFDDPYDDISDPAGCAGVLAIGGYWAYSGPLTTVNNEDFRPAAQAYVIFNNNFGCFLGNADNLAEVAAHELGHAVGFGHSAVFDAIMRSSAYGGRGPRLGDDDRDGAHCHYPHAVSLTYPDGGETFVAGDPVSVTWTVSAEASGDPGVVDVEYSVDDGQSWLVVSTGEANDGAYVWTAPDNPSTTARARVVRHNRVAPTPAPFPAACSSDASDAAFTLQAAPTPVAGRIPASGAGALQLAHAGAGSLNLSWGASCSNDALGYAVYEGTLAALRGGSWDHAPVTCAAGNDLAETIAGGAGDRYYLVTAFAGALEGSTGTDSTGTPRPASATACAPRETGPSCP